MTMDLKIGPTITLSDTPNVPQPRLLDIGCGPAKRPGHIGLDWYAFPSVDIVRDVAKRGLPFDDNSVDGIWCQHFLEHTAGEDLLFLVEEMYRVSKPGIEWTIIVPDATSPNRYKDPTHQTQTWAPDSFDFWKVNEKGEHIIFAGPAYGRKAKLHLVGTALNGNKDRGYTLRVVKP